MDIDEDQHMDYPSVNEKERMISIYKALGKKTIFIRFNPDKYNTGKQPLNRRYTTLNKWLKTALENEPEHELSEIYMYYDGFNARKKIINEIEIDY